MTGDKGNEEGKVFSSEENRGGKSMKPTHELFQESLKRRGKARWEREQKTRLCFHWLLRW